jgi:ATP-dependent DNA ligase I
VLLTDVAQTSQAVAGTAGRLAKIEALAALLREGSADEARLTVSWLSGELPQRQIGVGWAALRAVPAPAEQPRLTITEVDATFSAIKAATGAGSQGRRRDLLAALLAAATVTEQQFLRGLLSGGLRQGALAGVMVEAVAAAAAITSAPVRRAAMLTGDLATVAALAMTDGAAALAAITLQVGRPIAPMLAQTAANVTDALDRAGRPALLQWKLDGARIQAHKSGTDVSIFTRSLDDITARLPDVVDSIRALPAHHLVVDGEVIALRPDGRPQPFQITASRVGTRSSADRGSLPLTSYLFDLLHIDGTDLLGEPASVRLAALDALVAPENRIGQIITDEDDVAAAFLADTLARGHEGIVVKALDAPYEAGRRGAGWLKIKPVHTLDLVVLAVEWGSGRRQGKLSNIHLGAADGSGGFVMLGKTFKGMTDEMLSWQTEHFLQLADGPTDGWAVQLRPEQVVEIAFDGVQRSSRYPGGVALRFARVVRYRDDKTAAETDTLETVRSFLPRP